MIIVTILIIMITNFIQVWMFLADANWGYNIKINSIVNNIINNRS